MQYDHWKELTFKFVLFLVIRMNCQRKQAVKYLN